ncbi:MAG TPA: phosphate signaling complex protein PhoU [Flavisolibacter sp.]|jgi:phosphate transport system protein|nr:phosphate signaling complex protein PhoU [Flavisolibacter sp.]
MTKLNIELATIKEETVTMWKLVQSQLQKGLSSLLNFDKDLAREVVMIEKRVNGAELKIDRDCEDIFAIYSPVAIDLRFLLAVLKINTNLERMGDIAEGIAKMILDTDAPFKKNLLDTTQVVEMYHESLQIVEEILTAFENEDSAIARGIFKRDEFLDQINRKANDLIMGYIKQNPQEVSQALTILSMIRRLERVGDQAENIAEEIIFYIEAKVIKHRSKKEKRSEDGD